MTRVAIGSQLDGFLIDSQLHEGAMAEIYNVSYADGRESLFPMVMKVPKMTAGDGGENITSFEVEHQILQVLLGNSIPKFVAAGDLSVVPYLVIERVDGQNLEDWHDAQDKNRDTASLIAELADIGARCAEALHSIHQQNACHLDLKPANIIRRKNGDVVLIDFGLSYHSDYPDLHAEEFRVGIGSPAWMAPEQVVGIRGDPRSDLFALGVILYELACDELPFGAPSTKGGIRQRLWMSPKPLRAIRKDIPEWFQEIVMRCLEPKAENRYPSAAHLAFDLRHPDQVKITRRGTTTRGIGIWTQMKRWFRAAGLEYEASPLPSQQIREVPLVMVGFPGGRDSNNNALWGLRLATERALGNRPGARLAVVTVMKSSDTSSSKVDKTETRVYRSFLTAMQSWVQGLDTEGHQVSYHVLENNDVAEALLQFARNSHVSLIILGAPTHGLAMQRFITTVPLKVAMEAPCTIMLVKEELPFSELQSIADQSANEDEKQRARQRRRENYVPF